MATAMKDGTRKVLEFLQNNYGQDLTAPEIAEALGMEARSVNGSFTSFQKKGWGVRVEAEVELADGSHKKVKYLRLTEDGRNVNPDEEQ